VNINPIQCFDIPPGTGVYAVKLYKSSWDFADRHRGVLTTEVIRDIALGQVALWATRQDGEPSERQATIIRRAANLVIQRASFESR
jgi:hypothetical protein